MARKSAGTVYESSGKWYYRIQISGKRKAYLLRNRDGTPCRTRTDAALASADLARIHSAGTAEEAGRFVREARALDSAVPLEEALVRCNAQRGENRVRTRVWRSLMEWLGGRPLDADAAAGYMRTLEHLSGCVYNTHLLYLRSVYAALGTGDNPFSGIRRRRPDTVSRCDFTEEQVERIFGWFDSPYSGQGDGVRRLRPQYRVAMLLCCYAGCRGQDAYLMRWGSVDFVRGVITYCPRKTAGTSGMSVAVPMHPAIREALDGLERAGEYILPDLARRYLECPDNVTRMATRIIHAATGLETSGTEHGRTASRYSMHSFRHTFVSFCANAGVPLEVVASIVGHTSPAMTRHYSHISQQARQKAVASLPGGEEGQKERAHLAELARCAPLELVRQAIALLGGGRGLPPPQE